MRQVSIAVVKDQLSQFAAAANAGEEIVITRHGKPYARLVPVPGDRAEDARRRIELIERLNAVNAEVLRRHGPTPVDQIVDWINEDRR